MTGWLHFDVHGRAHHHTVCMAVHTNRSWSGFYVFKKQKYPPPQKNYLFCLLLTGRKEEEEVKQRLDVEGVKKHGAGGQFIIIIS